MSKDNLICDDFSDFPTTNDILNNKEESWMIIDRYIQYISMSMKNHFETLNKREQRKIKESLEKPYNSIGKQKLSDISEIKEKKCRNLKKSDRPYFGRILFKQLLEENKLQTFIEEHGEVKDHKDEFIKFCKEIARGLFIERCDEYQFYNNGNPYDDNQISKNNSEDLPENQVEYNAAEEYDTSENKEKNEIIERVSYIKNYIIDEIGCINNHKVKQLFILYFYVFVDDICRNKELAPSDMDIKIRNNSSEVFGEVGGTKLNAEEKEIKIKEYLDPLSFWDDFGERFQTEIKELQNYHKTLSKLISDKKTKRTQQRQHEAIRKDMLKFLDEVSIKLQKEEELQNITKKIIEHFKEFTIPDGLIRINMKNNRKIKEQVLETLSKNNPCGYGNFTKENISLYAINEISGINIYDKQKADQMKAHFEECSICRRYYKMIRDGFSYRKKREDEILYQLHTVYKNPETLTEQEYLTGGIVDYYKKEFRKNPSETNYQYLILAYIKNNDLDYAKKIYNDGLFVYKKGVFMQKTKLYIDNNCKFNKETKQC